MSRGSLKLPETGEGIRHSAKKIATRHHPKSIYDEKMPIQWHFSLKRIDRI